MTVCELRDWCDWYIKHGDGDIMLNDVDMDKERYEQRKNNRVVVSKDGIVQEFTPVCSAVGTTIAVETKPAVIEIRKEIVKEEVPTFGNYHWEDNDGNECAPGRGHIVGNPPIYRDVEKDVPVQMKPPEYDYEEVACLVVSESADDSIRRRECK